MNQVRENSKIPRRSPPGSDQLHVVAGTSTNVRSLSADEAKMLDHTQPRGTGPKGSSPEVAIFIGIPRQSNDLDDSDPPVENFEVFQYEEDDDDDDDEEDETFQLDEEGEEGGKGGHHDGEDRGFKRGRRNHGGRFYRKRKKSGTYGNDVNYVPPYKKRFRRQTSVLPTKFLLGGNIRDPLNLASLADAKVNAELNAETPKSSPVPVPLYRRGEVPVFIPKNPDDPLGLQCETQNPHDFIAGIRNNSNAAKGRKRHRKRPHGRKRTDSECSVDKSDDSDGKGDKDVSVSSEDDKRAKLDESGYESTNKVEKSEEVKDQVSKPAETKEADQKPVIGTKKEEEEPKKVEPEPGTSSGITAAKKRSRTRRKNKKFNVGPMGQLLSNIFNSRQTSDYVPLGTPSVHESNWYQFTPGRNSEYQYEYQAMPFESPLLADFSSDYGVDGSCAMEPFSPPPAPEHPSRRIVSEAAGSEDQVDGSVPASVVKVHQDQDNTFLKPQAPAPFARHVKKRIRHRGNPIVSPVVPQPGCRRRMGHHGYHGHQHYHHNPHLAVHHSNKQLPAATVTSQTSNSVNRSKGKAGDGENGNKYRRKDELFQYGNYNRYYGYRSAEGTEDNRLWAFSKDFFANKDVLDVGCNIGHITLTIARDYGAKMVTGVDIDPKLIGIAKKNVKHYVDRDPTDETIRFPHSCSLMYGMLQPPPANLKDTRSIPFPYNVSFRHENYVLDSDDLLNAVVPEYDVILCLSITKWVHLNNGDDGLKRFFRRSFLHLRPGGKLVLEPQPWSSYTKKKRLTETISCNYKAIRLYPDQFQDYLIKEVGYESVEKIHIPLHNSKGFQRPLMVFTKSEAASTVDDKGKPSALEMDTSVCAAATSTTSPIITTTTTTEAVTSSSATGESSLPSPSECVVTTSGAHLSSP